MSQVSHVRPASGKALRAGVVAFCAGLALAAVLATVDMAAGPGAAADGLGMALGTVTSRVLTWGGAALVLGVLLARALSRR